MLQHKIVQVVPSVADISSGPTYTVLRLSEQLRDQGNDVTVACLDTRGHRSVPGWVRRFPRLSFDRRLGISPEMHRWLRSLAATDQVPILHNNSLWMMPNVYPGWIARKYRLPYIVSPHGTLGKAAFEGGSRVKLVFWPLVQRPALASVSCFHATAESEAREIRSHGFRQPIAVVPNGVDVPTEIERGPRAKEVLYLGRIHPKKGIDVLLHAWGRIEDSCPGWSLRIAGPDNGGYLSDMMSLSRSLSIKRASFDGELLGPERDEAYRRASLFVLSTRNENFGMTVAEALSRGTPAIVTTGAPWSGLRTHGCGWWIDQGVDPLARALKEAMALDPGALADMGERGWRWVNEEFSWRSVGRDMEAVYRWVAEGMIEAARPKFVNPRVGEDSEPAPAGSERRAPLDARSVVPQTSASTFRPRSRTSPDSASSRALHAKSRDP